MWQRCWQSAFGATRMHNPSRMALLGATVTGIVTGAFLGSYPDILAYGETISVVSVIVLGLFAAMARDVRKPFGDDPGRTIQSVSWLRTYGRDTPSGLAIRIFDWIPDFDAGAAAAGSGNLEPLSRRSAGAWSGLAYH